MPHSKEALRPLLQPYFKVLEQIIRDGFRYYFEAYASEIARHSKRTRATLINDHIVDCAKRLLPPGLVRSMLLQQRNLFSFGDNFMVHFKKMDRKKLASNIPTLFSIEFNKQLDLPGLPATLPRLVAGYVPKKDWSGVEDVFVTCPVGDEIEWFFDLPLENAASTTASIPLPSNETLPTASIKRSRINRDRPKSDERAES